jgi:Protein of unknown function (DUF3574)
MSSWRAAFIVRTAIVALLGSVAVAAAADAAEVSCPIPNQTPMLVVQLFFGLSIKDRGPVSESEWKSFLRQTVTPRFPDGFTVYDGYGQWLNPKTHSIAREKSKIILIAVPDSEVTRAKISEVSAAYQRDFHQQAVGILTQSACGRF